MTIHRHIQCSYMYMAMMKYIMDFELTGLVHTGAQIYKMTTSCILHFVVRKQ